MMEHGLLTHYSFCLNLTSYNNISIIKKRNRDCWVWWPTETACIETNVLCAQGSPSSSCPAVCAIFLWHRGGWWVQQHIWSRPMGDELFNYKTRSQLKKRRPPLNRPEKKKNLGICFSSHCSHIQSAWTENTEANSLCVHRHHTTQIVMFWKQDYSVPLPPALHRPLTSLLTPTCATVPYCLLHPFNFL